MVTAPVVMGPPVLQMFRANETLAAAFMGINPGVPTQLLTMVMLGGGGGVTGFTVKLWLKYTKPQDD